MKYIRKRVARMKARAFYPWEYGKYYGPGWSAGKRVPISIDYSLGGGQYVPRPVDDVDRYAMYHDAAYARVYKDDFIHGRKTKFSDKRLADADFEFARRELRTLKPYGIIGGIAVGAQGAARRFMRFLHR